METTPRYRPEARSPRRQASHVATLRGANALEVNVKQHRVGAKLQGLVDLEDRLVQASVGAIAPCTRLNDGPTRALVYSALGSR